MEPRLTVRRLPAAEKDAALVCLAGELDVHTVQLLTETLVQLAEHPGDHRRVLLDLADVTYCDRGGLFALLGVCNALNETGFQVTITAVSTLTHTMINIADLGNRLPLRHL
ncbi:hypothetical protein GCM10010129_00930 [Streptomyces fumigatiscleroticus]|nr:hypothetical protein GCM10010129_00930 [Streptomyces fumigatiscleroticus]